MTINAAIARIEAKGYKVSKRNNANISIIDTDCPVVYAILMPDYRTVYGAGAVRPDKLDSYERTLRDLTAKVEQPAAKRHGVCPHCHTYCNGDCATN